MRSSMTRQIGTLLRGHLREVARNRLATFFTFLLPLLFVVVFGFSSSSRATPKLALAVDDHEHSPASSMLTSWLAGQAVFELVPIAADAPPAEITITIPAGALDRTRSGDGTRATVEVTSNDAQAPLVTQALDAARVELASHGPPAFAYTLRPPREAGNLFMLMLPGIIAMALLQLGLFSTASPLLTARQTGTLRHLSTTPVSRLALLLAQIALRLLIGAAQVGSILIAAVVMFHAAPTGQPIAIALVAAEGAVMLIAIGYALAGVAPSRDAGQGLVLLVNFAMVFLGGIFFAGPGPLRWIAMATPISYLADALRQVVFGAPGQHAVIVDAIAMAAWTLAATALALKTFTFDMRERG